MHYIWQYYMANPRLLVRTPRPLVLSRNHPPDLILLEILLEAKANIEQRMKNSQSIFHLLPHSSLSYQAILDIFHAPKIFAIFNLINQAETENEYVVTRTRERNAPWLIYHCYYSWTPLHMACDQGRRELIKLYIDYGADIRARTKENKTPRDLLLARMEGRLAEILHRLACTMFIRLVW